MRGDLRIAFIVALAGPLALSGGGIREAFAADSSAPASLGADLDAAAESEVQDGRRGDRACSRTAKAALRACRHEAQDDFWIAFGKCLNLADGDERRECIAEAEVALRETAKLCGEQHEAREEVCRLLGQAAYDPEIDPDDFLHPKQAARDPNPYFPLVPGSWWRYRHGEETIEVRVTDETTEILGVTCFVVTDVVREKGVLIEDTQDWFAQDKDGNVWYMGELAKNYEEGLFVNLDGSWRAGVDGAKPGLIMKASPRVGDVYRQEFLLGEAEDLARVLSLSGNESTEAASCQGSCVVTRELTPIEPGRHARKYYATGVGFILEISDEGEREELVEYQIADALIARSSIGSSPALAGAALFALRVGSSGHGSVATGWTVDFQLARESDIRVDVFDSAGRRVRTLVDERRRAGSQTLVWDGKDTGERRVASGVYFVHVRAGAESISGKIVVLGGS
jgi:hypothetical protein